MKEEEGGRGLGVNGAGQRADIGMLGGGHGMIRSRPAKGGGVNSELRHVEFGDDTPVGREVRMGVRLAVVVT